MIFQPKYKDIHGIAWGIVARNESALLLARGHVNRGPEHMPLGPADHLTHIRRLRERGERDES